MIIDKLRDIHKVVRLVMKSNFDQISQTVKCYFFYSEETVFWNKNYIENTDLEM